MEVRQIFFKKFCQRCAKAKKENNERDDSEGIIFKCQKELGQATLKVSGNQ